MKLVVMLLRLLKRIGCFRRGYHNEAQTFRPGITMFLPNEREGGEARRLAIPVFVCRDCGAERFGRW